MCLKRATGPKIATKDIKCYKILRRTPKNLYATIYRMKYQVRKTYTSELEAFYNGSEVHKGLHSFSARPRGRDISQEYPAVLCVIPKGATYYKGKQGSYKNGYASNKIKIVKILK
jgi:hypothetical protein